jgi:hypothetical protein
LDTGGLAGEDEDTGADDHADPEQGELDRAQPLAELVGRLLGVCYRLLDAFGSPEVHNLPPHRVAHAARDQVWKAHGGVAGPHFRAPPETGRLHTVSAHVRVAP